MKKAINFLPALAILLASGLAVATTSTTTYNVYWDGSDWQNIPSGQTVNCDSNPEQNCKAFRNAQGHISDIVKGDRLP